MGKELYFFPSAFVINYSKLGGYKQCSFIILQFLKPEVQNEAHWDKTRLWIELYSFLEALGGNVFLCFFSSFLRLSAFLGWWSPSICKEPNNHMWKNLGDKHVDMGQGTLNESQQSSRDIENTMKILSQTA